MTPYTGAEVRAVPGRGDINRVLRSHRIYVEHVIKHLKTFRVVGSIYYRHPRWEMSMIVELAAGLAQRRVTLFDELYISGEILQLWAYY